mmetsp:Transcript_6658/g.11749  ORF Transcript_6658/g.11749 Transcript_6658/m.11749 type:complete len:200 (-) Transcript_6658:1006-1605(-)
MSHHNPKRVPDQGRLPALQAKRANIKPRTKIEAPQRELTAKEMEKSIRDLELSEKKQVDTITQLRRDIQRQENEIATLTQSNDGLRSQIEGFRIASRPGRRSMPQYLPQYMIASFENLQMHPQRHMRSDSEGLTQEEVDAIPIQMCDAIGVECLVCNSMIDETQKSLGCGHSFHPVCLDEYLYQRSVCPVCGFSVSSYQ